MKTLKKYKEEIILFMWILNLITLLILADINLHAFIISILTFFALSIYIILHINDFERITDKLQE